MQTRKQLSAQVIELTSRLNSATGPSRAELRVRLSAQTQRINELVAELETATNRIAELDKKLAEMDFLYGQLLLSMKKEETDPLA